MVTEAVLWDHNHLNCLRKMNVISHLINSCQGWVWHYVTLWLEWHLSSSGVLNETVPHRIWTLQRNHFNKSISRARRFIRVVFGILYVKWHILSKETEIFSEESCIVVGCAFQHLLRGRDGDSDLDHYKVVQQLNVTEETWGRRSAFKKYVTCLSTRSYKPLYWIFL